MTAPTIAEMRDHLADLSDICHAEGCTKEPASLDCPMCAAITLLRTLAEPDAIAAIHECLNRLDRALDLLPSQGAHWEIVLHGREAAGRGRAAIAALTEAQHE